MEDALVQYVRTKHLITHKSLNPCFNGRCTSTTVQYVFNTTSYRVLILVLMEDALVLLFILLIN